MCVCLSTIYKTHQNHTKHIRNTIILDNNYGQEMIVTLCGIRRVKITH